MIGGRCSGNGPNSARLAAGARTNFGAKWDQLFRDHARLMESDLLFTVNRCGSHTYLHLFSGAFAISSASNPERTVDLVTTSYIAPKALRMLLGPLV